MKKEDKNWRLSFKDVPVIYDTIRFEAGKTHEKVSFFTEARDQELVPGTNKTPTHTNMACSGVLSGIRSVEILFIKLEFRKCLSTTELNMETGDFDAFINGFGAINYNKDYQKRPDRIYEAPLKYFVGGLKPEIQFITVFSCFNIDLIWEPPGFVPIERFDAILNVFGKPYLPEFNEG